MGRDPGVIYQKLTRPSGTEDIYRIYAESFKGSDHLTCIIKEAQAVVSEVLGTVNSKETL